MIATWSSEAIPTLVDEHLRWLNASPLARHLGVRPFLSVYGNIKKPSFMLKE